MKKMLIAILSIAGAHSFADNNQDLLTEPEVTTPSVVMPLNDNEALIQQNAPVVSTSLQVESKDFASAWGVSVQVSTLGLGVNLAHALYDDYLDIRGQYNYMSYDVQIDSNQYAINFGTMGLLLDYKPFGGVFRFTGGLYYDNRAFTASGSDITVSSGDNTYTASGSMGLKYQPIAPYLGIGVGSQAASSLDKKGIIVAFDAGLMCSKASTTSNLTCTSSGSGGCEGFDQAVQDSLNQLNSGLTSFPYYPVLSLGVGYRF